MKNKLVAAWYSDSRWPLLLTPLAALFGLLSRWRKRQLSQQQAEFPLPVIVVGNITLGGVGKTPVVIALVQHLQSLGYKPAVISRGYGGRQEQFPLPVDATTNPLYSGDEPVLIAKRCGCPVVVDPQRINAAVFAVQQYDCDVIVSDDGLQHYALPRSYELLVIDGNRGLGNRRLLPAGPLREAPARMATVNAVLINGECTDNDLKQYPKLTIVVDGLVQLEGGAYCASDDWQPQPDDAALAAIGNPGRFSASLASIGINTELICFDDHYSLQPSDMPANASRIIMTEKDAVKCTQFNDTRLWYLAISAKLPESLLLDIEQHLRTFKETH